jgi:hypothetical protein
MPARETDQDIKSSVRLQARMRAAQVCLVLAAISGWAASASGQSSLAGTTFHITRATGPIRVDGDLSDEAWRDAIRIDTWYEVQPGDNGTPPVKSVGHLTYDDRFFYAAFEFDDPSPSTIRAPLGDHDAINGNSMDFGGIFIDPALFAYKLNWQSVMFVGYGDERELMDQRQLERLDRQVFVKLSYAFQRQSNATPAASTRKACCRQSASSEP